jgi:hypothetical protein
MEIFWFCDTHTPEELEELDRMPGAEAEQKDPMARRLEILSRLHEMLFGTRAGQCTLCDGDRPKPFGAQFEHREDLPFVVGQPPGGYHVSSTYAFTSKFTAAACGNASMTDVMFDDGRSFVTFRLLPEQTKHCYSLFSSLYEHDVAQGRVEPYTTAAPESEPPPNQG